MKIRYLLHVLLVSFLLTGCGGGGNGDRRSLVTEHVTITGLSVEESQVGVEHPLHIRLTAVSEAAISEVDVAVGLMQKVSASATDEEKQAAHSCMLGLATIQNLQANTPASSSEVFVVHQDCLGPDGSAIDYNVFVILNPYDEVEETGAGQGENNSIVYNESESWRTENAACLSDGTGAPGCIFDVRVVPNPGLNLEFSQLKLESPTLMLYPTSDSADVVAGSNEHNEPNLKADVIINAYGVSAQSPTTLPAGTGISYSICPAADDCQSQHWLPLTIYSNPHEPAGHKRTEALDSVTGHTNISFSHALYAEGGTLAALLPGGRWATVQNFLVRGCLITTGDTDATNNCQTAAATRQVIQKSMSPRQEKAYRSNIDFSKSNDNSWGEGTDITVTSNFSISDSVDTAGADIVSVYKSWGDGAELATFQGSANARTEWGSGVALSVSSFGSSVYSYAKTGTKIYYPWYDWWRVAKQRCETISKKIYILKFDVNRCLTGQIGFKGSLFNEIEDQYPVLQKNGRVSYGIEKTVDFDGSVSGSTNIELTRAGVNGSYTVLHEHYKPGASAEWVLYEEHSDMSSMSASAYTGTTWDCSSLSGSVTAYADVARPDLCPKPPFICRSWERVYDQTLQKWTGEVRKGVTLIDRRSNNVVIMSPW